MLTQEDIEDYFLEFTDVHPYRFGKIEDIDLDDDDLDIMTSRIFIKDNPILQKAFRQRTKIYYYGLFQSGYSFELQDLGNQPTDEEIQKELNKFKCDYYEGYHVVLLLKGDVYDNGSSFYSLTKKQKNDIHSSLIKTVNQISRRTGMRGFIEIVDGEMSQIFFQEPHILFLE